MLWPLAIELILHHFDVFNNDNKIFGDVFKIEYNFDYGFLWEPVPNTNHPTSSLSHVPTSFAIMCDGQHDFNALEYHSTIVSATTSVINENEIEIQNKNENGKDSLLTPLATYTGSNYITDFILLVFHHL